MNYIVLYQRGTHNDECVRWFQDESIAIAYAQNTRTRGVHWYMVLAMSETGPAVVTSWGERK